MRIGAINNNQTNTNFNAVLKVRGDVKFLPKGSVERLTEKAKNIGTVKDIISLNIIENGNLIDPMTRKAIGFFNRVRVAYSITSTEKPLSHISTYKAYGQTEEICGERTYEIFDKYVDVTKKDYEETFHEFRG